jgi:cyclophilin family peptidyl-prolyl cis-trans isomerase
MGLLQFETKRPLLKRLALLSLLAVLAPSHLRADSLAQFHFPIGDLLVVLYDQDKPATVSNFRQYVLDSRFNDSFVQRWEPGFVIQGGGWFVTNRHAANPSLAPIRSSPSITNEFSVGRHFSNTFGTLAMARVAGQTNSASSQWFFNLASNTGLDAVDGGFTVFGRVAVGTNVLARFNIVTVANGLYTLNLSTSLPTIPVLSRTPTYEDLVYNNITLPAWPSAQIVREAGGTRRISWNSIANLTNHVEFTTAWPPAWQTLSSTVGTGATLEFRDTRTPATAGFYRIRIE